MNVNRVVSLYFIVIMSSHWGNAVTNYRRHHHRFLLFNHLCLNLCLSCLLHQDPRYLLNCYDYFVTIAHHQRSYFTLINLSYYYRFVNDNFGELHLVERDSFIMCMWGISGFTETAISSSS